MKNLSIAFIIVLIFATNSWAKFLFLSLEDQVKASEFIVIGKLNSISTSTEGDFDISEGTLTIEKLISDNVRTISDKSIKPGDKIPVRWRNSNTTACRFSYSENDYGIWFLRIDKDKTPLAFHQSRADLSELKELNKILPATKQNKTIKRINSENDNNSDSTQDALLRALLVFIVALILYRLLYRVRFKIKVKKEKKDKE
jgi:hypothetical protein